MLSVCCKGLLSDHSFNCLCYFLFICYHTDREAYLQKDNIRNQRENVVLALANAQSRLGLPDGADPVSVAG